MALIPEYSSFEEKSKVFAKYRRIDNVADFEAWYNGLQKGVFFRGMKEAKYKNFTSAQREYIRNDFAGLPSTYVYYQLQYLKEGYNNLLKRYCEAAGIAYTDFYLMSFAQHHSPGISLLLDVTSDINTALYFMRKNKETDARHNNLNDYASIYVFQRPSITLKDIINEMSSKITYGKERNYEQFKERCKYATQMLCKLTTPSFLLDKHYFLIENLHYRISYEYKDYSYNDIIMVTNLNMVAQNGSFLFYNYDNLSPLEEEVDECLDIRKSLIPYISRKYLTPNHKTKKELFPVPKTLVKNAYNKMLSYAESIKNNYVMEINMPYPNRLVL